MPTVSRDRFDALIFDLDGTLLDGRSKLSAAVKAEIDRVRGLGYLVVLATGRSLGGTKEVYRELGLDTEVVCYNGAWIGRPDGGAPWHYTPIPDDLIGDLGGAEAHAGFHYRHHLEAKYTATTAHPHHARVSRWYTNVVHVDPAVATLPARELLRVSLFFDDEPRNESGWNALPAHARARLHREVFPLSIFPDFHDVGLVLCEVQVKGRGKAEALRYLAERHGVPAARVVAVGDQRNDLPMLEGAGLAVAMGNAVPEAKALADLVIGDHREDGVARFLADAVR